MFKASKNLIPFLSLLALGLYSGCSTFVKSGKSQATEYKFYPTWVSDTLSHRNLAFRKVNLFSPLSYKNNLIVANALDGLTSYDKNSKNTNWKKVIKHGIESAGVTSGSTLYVGALNGEFLAVNLDNGETIWAFETAAEITAEPLLHNGVLYFLNGANMLYSLDAHTGKLNWVYNRQETTAKMTVRGGSRPVFSNGLLYTGFSDGALVAVNAATGTVQWEVQLNNNLRFKDIDASPVIDGDYIYLSSYDDKFYCLSKSNGDIVWKSEVGGATAPLIVGDKIVYASSNESIISLSKKDGSLLWKKSTRGLATEPSILKGLVIYGESAGALVAVDLLTGDEMTRFAPGRGIMSKPYVDENQHIYFISGQANVYRVELKAQSKTKIPFLSY